MEQVNKQELKSFSIKELFTQPNTRYEIPVYQRDYAWKEFQIRQLIQDVVDYAKDKPGCNYYIGTLIVYERLHNDLLIYETIDGQQRLTTLSILLILLRNEYKAVEWFEKNILSFACRPGSTESLNILFKNEDPISYPEVINKNILQGYEDAKKSLKKILQEKCIDFASFVKYLEDKVYILRVPVPFDTDLNHYFEIMNSRGEQLEKHEILKARCLNCLTAEEGVAFNKIWEATANMERYVQYGFSVKERNSLFGEDNSTEHMWDTFACSEKDVYEHLKNPEAQNDKSSLEEIIKENFNSSVVTKNADDEPVRFNTVINFSNFLLHVLRIQTGENIPLDDKRLINTFESYLKNENTCRDFVKSFGFNLLKMKYLYDKFIIKREFSNGKDQWSLKRVHIYGSAKKSQSYSYSGTFSDDDKNGENREIIMLLAMFHVSTPTLTYKHWLNGALKWCFDKNGKFTFSEYKTYLEKMARTLLRDRFLSKFPLDYYDIIFKNSCESQNNNLDENAINCGTDVENFIFNYLDYLLWQNYRNDKSAFNVIGDNAKLLKDKRILDFEYTFRSSVEHYYPQNPIEGKEYIIDSNDLNCFGNLCLISGEKNSRLSNYMPLAKKEHYEQSDRIDSIKQRIMMAYNEWDNGGLMDKNQKNEIRDHYEKMVSVLLGNEHGFIKNKILLLQY